MPALSACTEEEIQCKGEEMAVLHSHDLTGDTTGRHHKREMQQDHSITFNCDSELLA